MTVICINCTVPPLLSFLRTVGIFASAFRFFCSGFSLPSSPHPACPLARRIYFHATLAHCHRKCHTHTHTETETQPHSAAVSQRLGKQATWLHWLLALSSCCRFLLHCHLPLSSSFSLSLYIYILCVFTTFTIYIYLLHICYGFSFFFVSCCHLCVWHVPQTSRATVTSLMSSLWWFLCAVIICKSASAC